MLCSPIRPTFFMHHCNNYLFQTVNHCLQRNRNSFFIDLVLFPHKNLWTVTYGSKIKKKSKILLKSFITIEERFKQAIEERRFHFYHFDRDFPKLFPK